MWAPAAIASLRARCITMNFVSPWFSSADMRWGRLGSGRACACLGAAGPSSPRAPAAACCAESQAAAEQEGQGLAFTASPPTKRASPAAGERRCLVGRCQGRRGKRCSVRVASDERARRHACAGTWSKACAVLPGKHPKNAGPCRSPSPISQETKGLLHTDLLWPAPPSSPQGKEQR